MEQNKQSTIASLNDTFRRSDRFVLTPGVQELEDLGGLMKAVSEFDDFTEDNDPHGEHDFGSMSWAGNAVFWKIDYYDQNLEFWCDPLSPECNRVLTVLLASEY